jgi:uncharacterized Zn finger protein
MSRGAARFDAAALRDRAGDTTFARGEAYQRSGQVAILSFDAARVVARVSGGEDYRTVVTGAGAAIGGECSCPAYEDSGFCKHMVAVALAANAAAGDDPPPDPLEPIRDHLRSQEPAALVALLLDLAERDPALLRRLEIAAAAVKGDVKALEARLRKAIDGATRTRGFVEYRAVRGWAEGVDEALDALEGLAAGPHAAAALRLAEHALARLGKAIGQIDDSDGRGGGLLARARDIHLAACRAVRPDPLALARDLFARETGDDYDTFHAASEMYADVLGDAGRAEYRRLAAAAWDRLPPRGPRDRDGGLGFSHTTIAEILDRFAAADGDVGALIALRSKDLSTPYHYLRLAEFCREHGRPAEALACGEEGLWIFEAERPDERLLRLVADLLVEAGRAPEAEAHLWRGFERAPSFELYRTLRQLAGEPAGDRAIATLGERLAMPARGRWSGAADLMVRVLLAEERFGQAWEVARDKGVSEPVAEALARATEASHPHEALAVYAARVERLVALGGTPNYQGAAELVARMADLRDAAEQAAYVAGLKDRHGRKRNFMKLLE